MSIAPAIAPFVEPSHWRPVSSSRGRARRAFARRVIYTCNQMARSLQVLSATDSSACQSFTPAHADIRASLFRRAVIFCQSRRRLTAAQCGQQPGASTASEATPLSYMATVSSALPIVADLVDLPATRPTARLADLLPPAAAQLLTPSAIILPEADHVRPRPTSALGERCQYIALLRRLIDSGMAATVPADSVRQRVSLFCVAKKNRLRLICNARPTNAVHRIPPHTQLPNPGWLGRLEASEFVAGVQDLSAYYSTLLLPDWLVPWFGLPQLSADEARALGVPPAHQLALAVVPMGWSWAVYFAQAAHQHILAAADIKASLMLSPVPHILDDPEVMVYIDDATTVAAAPYLVQARAVQARLTEIYAARGLTENPSKQKQAAPDPVVILGLLFDGKCGRITPSPADLQDLIEGTKRVLAAVQVTTTDLRSIVGRWLWFGLLNRPFISIFSATFALIKACAEFAGPIVLWEKVQIELGMAIDLAPLLIISTRLPWCDSVIASDASNTGFGVCLAEASPDMCRELVATLPHPAQQPHTSAPTTAVDTAAALPWRPVVARAWRRRHASHITSGEMFALTIGFRHCVAARRACDSRILLLTDNTAVLGAVQKGRSSAAALRGPSRVLSAWLLATGCRLEVRYIPSQRNPADAPSRLHGNL
jgi:hypothetical protein